MIDLLVIILGIFAFSMAIPRFNRCQGNDALFAIVLTLLGAFFIFLSFKY